MHWHGADTHVTTFTALADAVPNSSFRSVVHFFFGIVSGDSPFLTCNIGHLGIPCTLSRWCIELVCRAGRAEVGGCTRYAHWWARKLPCQCHKFFLRCMRIQTLNLAQFITQYYRTESGGSTPRYMPLLSFLWWESTLKHSVRIHVTEKIGCSWLPVVL